jgi:beta-lactamase superfamily II metal-dependent hydrolase
MPGSGAGSLNPPGWIASLHPQVILLSVPAQNRSSLPDAEALQAAQGFQILRTDQNGWIEITTDGRQMWVTEEKK